MSIEAVLYLSGVLDKVHKAGSIIFPLALVALFVFGAIWIALRSEVDEDSVKIVLSVVRSCRLVMFILLISLCIFVFCPTKNTALLMFIVPRITRNEEVTGITRDVAVSLRDILRDYADSLDPNMEEK